MTGLVRIKITEGKDIPQRLRKIRRGMENRAPFHKVVGRVLEKDIANNFRMGKDADGRRLAPLHSNTIRQREATGVSGRRILVRTGAFQRSIKTRVERRGRKESATVIAPSRSQIAKASAHQFGRRVGRGRKRIPIRAVMGINPRRQRFVEREWFEFHEDQLEKHTRR